MWGKKESSFSGIDWKQYFTNWKQTTCFDTFVQICGWSFGLTCFCSDVVDCIRLFQLRILVVRLEGHYLHDTFSWTESNNHVKGLFHKCSDSIWMGLKSNWPTACTWLKKRRPEVQPETIPPQMTAAALPCVAAIVQVPLEHLFLRHSPERTFPREDEEWFMTWILQSSILQVLRRSVRNGSFRHL